MSICNKYVSNDHLCMRAIVVFYVFSKETARHLHISIISNKGLIFNNVMI